MKTIEDGRNLIMRNHDAREYHYSCRRRNEAKWNRICWRMLAVSFLFLAMTLLVGAAI